MISLITTNGGQRRDPNQYDYTLRQSVYELPYDYFGIITVLSDHSSYRLTLSRALILGACILSEGSILTSNSL